MSGTGRTMRIWGLMALCVAGLALSAAKPPTSRPTSKPEQAIIVRGTQEAALGQPRIIVQLRDGKRILTGEAQPSLDDPLALGDARRASSFQAYLDTGASGCVLSKATAERFSVEHERDAAFHEVGLGGESVVDVAAPLDLCVRNEKPSKTNPDAFTRVLEKVRFQISREQPPALVQLAGGDLNVIGMPAIKSMVIEIDPSPLRGLAGMEALANDGPRVIVHDSKERPKSPDVVISLETIDFSQRKHSGNRGPLPALAANPVVPSVQTSILGSPAATFTCDWLLDSGAAASIISTRHAKALGLLKPDGLPAREPDFTLPLGGIGGGGGVKSAPGYVIDSLKVKTRVPSGKTLEFRGVHVVVRDISTTLDDGREITLDGVLGMNLLLPSASGLASGKPEKMSDGPFDRVWIDGVRNTLSLTLSNARRQR